jgi:hypothetical protein
VTPPERHLQLPRIKAMSAIRAGNDIHPLMPPGKFSVGREAENSTVDRSLRTWFDRSLRIELKIAAPRRGIYIAFKHYEVALLPRVKSD